MPDARDRQLAELLVDTCVGVQPGWQVLVMGAMPGRPLLEEIVKLPDVNERLKGLAVDPAGSTSEEFARMIAAELPRWAAIAKAANIRLD